MTDKLKVGIAGLHRGMYLGEQINMLKDAYVHAVCELDNERLEKAKTSLNNPLTFTDYYDMLDCGLDIVIISSPIQTHVPYSVASLSKNIHTFSEVPAANSLEQCSELIKAVNSSKAKYMMGENCCYMKPHMLVKNMVKAGLFGKLYYAEGWYTHFIRFMDAPGGWRDKYLYGRRGGTYITHPLGPILDWMDDKVVTVNCVGTGSVVAPEMFVDDCSVMLCTTSKGALIKIINDMSSPRPFHGYSALQGTLGAYQPDYWCKCKPERVCIIPPEDARKHAEYEWKSLYEYENEYMPDIWKNRPKELEEAVHGGADGLMLGDFIKAIVEDKPSPIDVYRALDMTVPGLISDISANQGGIPVAVPDYRLL